MRWYTFFGGSKDGKHPFTKGGFLLPKNSVRTSAKVASKASKTLSSKKSSKTSSSSPLLRFPTVGRSNRHAVPVLPRRGGFSLRRSQLLKFVVEIVYCLCYYEFARNTLALAQEMICLGLVCCKLFQPQDNSTSNILNCQPLFAN